MAVDCATPTGWAHCIDAHVYPDSLCVPPGINWDGSSLEVDGRCVNDTVFFRIRNVGEAMTAPSSYVITEDLVIHNGNDFQLDAGEELVVPVPADGSTYRILVNQSPGHPGNSNPSATLSTTSPIAPTRSICSPFSVPWTPSPTPPSTPSV